MNYIFFLSINMEMGGYPNTEAMESNKYGLWHKLWSLTLNLEHS